MKRLIALVLTLVIVLGLCACGNSQDEKAAGLMVGYAREKIHPEWSVPLAGYGQTEKRMSQNTLDYLYATCVAFKEGDTIILMFSQDLIRSTVAWVKEVRFQLSSKLDIPEENIMVSATHTHSAPDTTKDIPSIQSYRTLYVQQMVKAGEKAVADFMVQADKKKASQVAVVVMDKEGAVLAMIGGRDYKKSQFNRATNAVRQIGSTVKPFVYLTAFDKGAKSDDIEIDEKININGFSPKNAGGKYAGEITLADALIKSVNTVAVKVAVKAGLNDVLKTAQKFGAVNSDCQASPAFALGVCSTSPLDLTASYASLANGGYGVTPFAITEVRNMNDDVLFARNAGGRPRLIHPKSIVILDDLLRRVIEEGTGKKAFPSVLAKGKTGTTQNYRDAWFVGYTEKIAVGVWLGNDNDRPMDKVSGSDLPALLWKKIVMP